MSTERYRVLVTGTCKCYFTKKKGLCRCDDVKDSDIRRLSCIFFWNALNLIPGPYKREAEGDFICTEKEEKEVMDAEIGVIQLQVRAAIRNRKRQERKYSLEPPEGVWLF